MESTFQVHVWDQPDFERCPPWEGVLDFSKVEMERPWTQDCYWSQSYEEKFVAELGDFPDHFEKFPDQTLSRDELLQLVGISCNLGQACMAVGNGMTESGCLEKNQASIEWLVSA